MFQIMIRSILKILEFATEKWDGFIGWIKSIKRRRYEKRVDDAVDGGDNVDVAGIVSDVISKREKRQNGT